MSIDGSVVEFSPATRDARVRFPVNASFCSIGGPLEYHFEFNSLHWKTAHQPTVNFASDQKKISILLHVMTKTKHPIEDLAAGLHVIFNIHLTLDLTGRNN